MYVFIVCMYFLTINQQRTLELIFKAKKTNPSFKTKTETKILKWRLDTKTRASRTPSQIYVTL